MKGFTVSASALVATAYCGACGYVMRLRRDSAATATCPCGQSAIRVLDSLIHKTGAAERAAWETGA